MLVLAGRFTIDLPIGEGIPITGQTIAVLLTGVYLNQRHILIVYAMYLIGGSMLNMPFFADGSYGWSKLVGKSGGYLYSFPIAATYMHHLVSKIDISPWLVLLHGMIATAIILTIGMLHLSHHIGISSAWTYGVLPYLAGGIIKAVLVTVIVMLVSYGTTRRDG